MKIISFITDPELIRQILEHLGLRVQKSSGDLPSQEASHENGEIVYEPFDDGWPVYENPSIILKWVLFDLWL
jgi:hypothetical protein